MAISLIENLVTGTTLVAFIITVAFALLVAATLVFIISFSNYLSNPINPSLTAWISLSIKVAMSCNPCRDVGIDVAIGKPFCGTNC